MDFFKRKEFVELKSSIDELTNFCEEQTVPHKEQSKKNKYISKMFTEEEKKVWSV